MRKPYWSKARKRWFLRQGTSQINLGQHQEAAFERYKAIVTGELPVNISVREVIDRFLEWCGKHRAAGTVANYRHWLQSFLRAFDIRVDQLKPWHVTKWLDEREYVDNTANIAVRSLVRALNWAVKQGVIESSPLQGIERPAATPRECYIEPDQFQQLLDAVGENFHEFITVMRETGCRPQEIRRVEARHFDRVGGTWTFPRKEGKGKRPRVVVLTPRALEITQRLVLKHPTGPLFLNRNGKPWSRFAIAGRFERLSNRLGFSVTAYAIRHTWVTDALLNGVDPMTVATLAGHTSIKMIWQVYQHLQLQQTHMRKAAEQAVRKQA